MNVDMSKYLSFQILLYVHMQRHKYKFKRKQKNHKKEKESNLTGLALNLAKGNGISPARVDCEERARHYAVVFC